LTTTIESHWDEEVASHPDVYRGPQPATEPQPQEAMVPWWQSPQGRAEHEDRVRQMNDYNRRLMESQGQANGQPTPTHQGQQWPQPAYTGFTPVHQPLPHTYPVTPIQP